MLHHHQGIPQVAQVHQGVDEALVVALMEAYGRLVQDVEHAHEARADLRSQAYALRLAAGERAGLALQAQVLKADVPEERKARGDLFQDLLADLLLGRVQLERVEESDRVLDRALRKVVDVRPAHGHRQGLGPQALTAAGLAGLLAHEFLQPVLDAVARGLDVATLKLGQDAWEGRLVFKVARALGVVVAYLDSLVPAVEYHLHDLLGELAEGRVQAEAVMLGQGVEAGAVPSGVRVVGYAAALVEGQAFVRYHQVRVELQVNAQAGTGGAGAVRRIEAEKPGLQLR